VKKKLKLGSAVIVIISIAESGEKKQLKNKIKKNNFFMTKSYMTFQYEKEYK